MHCDNRYIGSTKFKVYRGYVCGALNRWYHDIMSEKTKVSQVSAQGLLNCNSHIVVSTKLKVGDGAKEVNIIRSSFIQHFEYVNATWPFYFTSVPCSAMVEEACDWLWPLITMEDVLIANKLNHQSYVFEYRPSF